MRTQSRFWWIPLAAAMVVVAAARPAEAQRTWRVDINSTPPGAEVRLDSESAPPLGVTPLRSVRVPRGGPHTLFFSREGYVTERVPANFTRNRETFTATMTQSGSIYVMADVAGAPIFLDGQPVGNTPGTISGVRPGPHTVEIRAPGMPVFQDSVNVTPGGLARLSATVRPAATTGGVRVIVNTPNGQPPPDLRVLFDGAPMQGTPPTAENVPAGDHIVQVTATGYRPITQTVPVRVGPVVPVLINLEPLPQQATGATLRVEVQTPNAQVILIPPAGSPLGGEQALTGSPPARADLPPGNYRIRVTAPGRREYTAEFTLAANETRTIGVPELPTLVETGRMAVRSTVPGASARIRGPDGNERNVPLPYEVEAMPAGEYTVVVRAENFTDATEHCRVAQGSPCELNVSLQRALGRGTLHVELSRAVPGAVLSIDGREIGEIGAGRDIPNLTAETHELRVTAPRYQPYVRSVTIREGDNQPVMVQLVRERGQGVDIVARRSAISTWGASTLARGDLAADFAAAYGSYPLEIRATTGFLQYAAGGIDAGFSVRTMGWFWEFELRSRVGYRALDGLLAIAGEARVFAGLGFAGQGNYGVQGFIVGSLHSLAPVSDADFDEDDRNARERTNRTGSFAVSLRIGFEAMNDGLNGMIIQNENGTARFDACGQPDRMTGMLGATNPCRISTNRQAGMGMMMPSTMGDVRVTAGSQGLVRALAGLSIEIGLSRYANLFVGIERVFGDPANRTSHRALYQAFWFGNDSFTYVRAGLTYKF